jgi:outer membrane protein insertion porin family
MSRKFLHLFSLVLFSCGSITPAFAQSPSSIEASEGNQVAGIDITIENLPANATFDKKAVIGKLKTKLGDPFSQLTFDADLKMLADEYDRVEPNLEVENGHVYISLKVWAKPTLRSITWEGNEHIKTSTLRNELNVKTNRTFNRQTFNKALNKVKEFYIKKGYFESQIYYTLDTDPHTGDVDITIHIKEGRSGKIDDIVFNGFTSSEHSDILNMIYTKKYNLFLSWISGTGIYNEEALDQDQLVIVNYLQNKGYADAKVQIEIKESEKEGRIIIEINAERGPVFHFGKITFDGNEIFTDKEIENCFIAHPDEIYSPEKLRETSQAIKNLYGRKGYIEANVQYETKIVENEPIYNIHFQIDEGKQYKIGIIHIFGNSNTEQRVILRESLLVPGETFDSAKLRATQQRLENIGFFKNVNVYAVRTSDDDALGPDYRDVYIEVEETSTGNVSLSFGLSTADSVFGSLDLTETNFNSKGLFLHRHGIKGLRGGGEYAHAKVVVGEKQRTYSISWLNPYLDDTLWRLGFDGTKNWSHLQSKHYEINTLSFTLYASYPITNLWTYGVKYRIRDTQVSYRHGATRAEKKDTNQHGVISSVGTSLNYDSTDSSVKPHNGFRSHIELDVAGFGGHFSFARFSYVNSYYRELWRHGILKCRFDFRFIEPMLKTSKPDQIPLSERFFLGGEGSVRGYRAFDLGPHFANGDPSGGISSSFLSLEYLHEVLKFLDLFIFVDAGSISMHRLQIGTYNLSYGFGARVELINRVPIVLGMGFPVNPDGRSEVRKFFFSMGGQF